MPHWALGLMIERNMMPRAIYIPNWSLLPGDLGKRFNSNALISQSENLGREEEGEYW